MSNVGDTFFTLIDCMDGRTKAQALEYGQGIFDARFADTITEAGIDKVLAELEVDSEVGKSIKNKIDISVHKHHSKGLLIAGHDDCCGNPVADEIHRDQIKSAATKIKNMVPKEIEVRGVFIKLYPPLVEEVIRL